MYHKSTHTKDKPFKCVNGCDKSFAQESQLKRHQESIHDHKRWHCVWEGCNKTFSTECYLRQHKKYFHNKNNKYQCPFRWMWKGII